MALAYAPLALVRQTFHIFEQSSDPRLAPLFQYFRLQWIINVPPAMWNVYNRQTRTNNDLEGWHNRFTNMVGRHRPNLWRLLACLQEEQAATEVAVQQIAAGQQVSAPNRRYKKIHRHIKKLQRRYRHGNLRLTDFITNVSHNLAHF
jgi:hypothetical protein